ncbi:LysM peptidoglycan-binding domain-containing protein [Massilia sp. PAMC28688]|uniref:LysM peptidoglycan-binding domain-containing protein n=1 Tax=Massilia sp. PAMC28688 TaxID=2861283 RepID=UPI001C62F6DE|nr:LysM peptidoglycan-binding domain-containing protein [Massilia sp. PAMC28688]QYF95284.1 LysM peptidoglycan-binding domain-containing protein [Massilia sp. PAMC28688]
MKKLLTAMACVALLGACSKEEPAPVATAPAVIVPVEPPAVVSTVPPTTGNGEVVSAPVTGAVGASVAGATEGSGDGMYVVEKGDTLWDIAEKNGISHGNLAKWNNVNHPRELQVGRQLRLTAP